MSKTLYEKLWDRHVIASITEDLDWLYVDRQYIFDFNSPLIESLRLTGQGVERPRRTIGIMDHAMSSAPGRTVTAPWLPAIIKKMRTESALGVCAAEAFRRGSGRGARLIFSGSYMGLLAIIPAVSHGRREPTAVYANANAAYVSKEEC